MPYTVKKRTFEALRHPAGSAERARLNLSSLTSQYMPSHKYVVCDPQGAPIAFSFPSKKQAEEKAAYFSNRGDR